LQHGEGMGSEGVLCMVVGVQQDGALM
jgi:hypothetical protein